MTFICNNVSECHDSIIIGEDNSAIRVYCSQCGQQERVGKDKNGNPELRLYSEWFKRDVLQPDTPLYGKYAGAGQMRVV